MSTSTQSSGRATGNSSFSVQALINRVNSQPRATRSSPGTSTHATAGSSRSSARIAARPGTSSSPRNSSGTGWRGGEEEEGYTIVDDGAPDPTPLPHRQMRSDQRGTAPSLYGSQRSSDVVYRNPTGSGSRSQRVHNTADDITPGRVREIIGGDIRKLGPNDYSVDYRLGMDDGSMRMIGYKFVDERGLRPMIDKWWRPRRYAGTDLQRAAYRAGCY